MKSMTWNLLSLQLLLLCGVQCHTITTSNSTVSIRCGNYLIAIRNGTESVVPHLLEQCNARHECEVSTTSSKPVEVHYWCGVGIPTMEIKSSSIMYMKPNQSAIGVMSEGYPNGTYQASGNITCVISFAKHAAQTKKEISFILYDFASFASFSSYCLSVEDSVKRPFCSGSHKYYTQYGPFIVKNGKQFSLELTSTTMETVRALQLRFWFDILVSQEGVHFCRMECHSKPGKDFMEDKPPGTNNGQIHHAIIGTLGTLLAFAVLVIICCMGSAIYRRSEQSGEQPDMDDHIYWDIDMLDCSVAPYGGNGMHNMVPDINVEKQLIEDLCHEIHLVNSVPDLHNELSEDDKAIDYPKFELLEVMEDAEIPDEVEMIENSCYGLLTLKDDIMQDKVSADIDITENPYNVQ